MTFYDPFPNLIIISRKNNRHSSVSLVVRLSVWIVLISIFSSCAEWSDSDLKRLNKLAKEIELTPSNGKLIDSLVSGMSSDETIRASNYIQIAGELGDIPQVRIELGRIVSDRIFGTDPWISRSCAEQLHVLTKHKPDGFDQIIRECLSRQESDVPWFALEAILELGHQGNRFTSDIGVYLKRAIEFTNTTGANRAARALLSIESEESLTILADYAHESNKVLRTHALAAQSKLKSRSQ